jgi:hypothetical protein
MTKKQVTKREFDNIVRREALIVHNRILRTGTFWPIQFCRKEVEKKIRHEYEITK